ncbi:MAG TPA: sigma-70 family RNA polymerase sigma factor [Dongiaceae bacterium]|nr:sigma-70 family RNA polymerase sigma factor [Dongiaceae bacterium]
MTGRDMMAGERLSLDVLADHIPALRRYAHVLARGGRDADDLVQEALLRAVDRLQVRADVVNMKSWLFTIMHNVFVSRLRKAHVRRFDISLEGDNGFQPGTPATQEEALRWRDLMRSFETLPDDQRQVLLLVAVEGLGYAEVAAVLDIPIGTVMSRLSRGREKLRQMMDGGDRPDTRTELRRVK